MKNITYINHKDKKITQLWIWYIFKPTPFIGVSVIGELNSSNDCLVIGYHFFMS